MINSINNFDTENDFLSELPNEIMIMIFEYLTTKDLLNFLTLNTKFYNFVHAIKWDKQVKFKASINDDDLSYIISRFEFTNVDCSRMDNKDPDYITDKGIKALSRCKKVFIGDREHITDEGIQALFGCEVISIHNCMKITFDGVSNLYSFGSNISFIPFSFAVANCKFYNLYVSAALDDIYQQQQRLLLQMSLIQMILPPPPQRSQMLCLGNSEQSNLYMTDNGKRHHIKKNCASTTLIPFSWLNLKNVYFHASKYLRRELDFYWYIASLNGDQINAPGIKTYFFPTNPLFTMAEK